VIADIIDTLFKRMQSEVSKDSTSDAEEEKKWLG